MKKSKLEDRIIGRVYRMETKKTFWYILSRAFVFLLSLFVVYIFASVLFEIFNEQGSMDLINFWGDDLEVVYRYLFDNIAVFLSETPREILLVLLLTITGLVYLSYKIVSNFRSIRNKVVSIYKFYKNKK